MLASIRITAALRPGLSSQTRTLPIWMLTRQQQRPGSGRALDRWISSQARAPELYRLLGIEPSASAREIKHGFLTQARLHHPDVSPNPGAAEMFDRIQGALTVLSNPVTRREYDTSFGCVQPDYVYAGKAACRIDQIPLAAMTEEDLHKEADHLEERIRITAKNLATLGDGAVVYKARGEELSEELRMLSERRAAVREELQKIAAARIRHGGGARARRKRPVFHAEYEYAERYSDVYKCARCPVRGCFCVLRFLLTTVFAGGCCYCLLHRYSEDPQLEDEAALEEALAQVLGMSPNAAGNTK